ncbi:hypothetical protein RZO55_20110 [Clostridium boliviensis]|uniref:Uncharacterized protein n=1 Tax=Clostridium boliviensis TaxID=318465 RepID=A0ABU4GQL2_9CLOT|nr:hypothetical protein [Clostridium boliviensis]MDW2799879.1 hypothetical protein [Clostridium boliviensis]
MRKSSKDCRADRASVNSRIQAEADAAIKAPSVMSFSAQMPAYTYTSLCPDPKLRKPPRQKREHPEGIQPAVTEKICLICRKHWPSDCKRATCDCKGQGHLFSTGVYYQRRRGGRADGT